MYQSRFINQLQLLFKIISHMSKPINFSHRKNSGRIIVDQYQRIKMQREQDVQCRFCKNQISSRLLASHQNVCMIENEFNEARREKIYQNKSQIQLENSAYIQEKNKSSKKRIPSRLASQRNIKDNSSQISKKKLKNNKIFQYELDFSQKKGSSKNLKENCRRPTSSNKDSNKYYTNKIFKNKKLGEIQKFQKKNYNNKSLLSQAEREYYQQSNKKKKVTKVNKQFKHPWLSKANQTTQKINQLEKNKQIEKIQKERLKKIQNETDKLKRQKQRIIRQLQKQRKNQKKVNLRNESKIKKQRQSQNKQRNKERTQTRIPARPRNQQTRNNATRNRKRNQQRYPTVEQSYYQQIPINHPHRTLNFISQTINEQFEMMKEQFQHMNDFFSSFVPFSNNGFVYFERGDDSDYSIDSSDQSVGYEEQQPQQGLFEQQIELLPRHAYIKRLGIEDQCAVCINQIKHNQMIRRLPCHHIFHDQCIDQWLKRKAMCPVCRDPINDLGQ